MLKEGRSYFTTRGYDVFDGWGDDARKIDPMSVNWQAVANGTLQVKMRQRPGPANSMGKMKFMFPNKEGIWLHDTPVQERIDDPARLASGGCVQARGCGAAPALDLRPHGQAAGQCARAEGRHPGQDADLSDLSDRGAERDADRLFRRFLRPRPRATGRRRA